MTSSNDSGTAEELFKLCKKVYELTGWDGYFPEVYWHRLMDKDYEDVKLIKYGQITTRDGARICPLYTSDYLLEKLLPLTDIKFVNLKNGNVIVFYNPSEPDYTDYESDTPLKCLLKLTITIQEESQIDKETNRE